MRGLLATTLFALAVASASVQCRPRTEVQPEARAEKAEAAPELPPGTVLLIDELAIQQSAIDEIAGWVEELHPEYTRIHCRRIALSEVVLPRAAVRLDSGRARDEALRDCRRAMQDLDTFDADAEGAEAWAALHAAKLFRPKGDWSKLRALDLWGLARGFEIGVWSEPIERTGSFNLVRLEAFENETGRASDEQLTLTLLTFPYLPEGATADDVEAAMGRRRLTIVDPAWKEIVPEVFQYSMRGSSK